MKRLIILILVLGGHHLFAQNQNDTLFESESPLNVTPIVHGTLMLGWHNEIIYVDPYGGKEKFTDLPSPSLVLITDIHGDHLNNETLNEIDLTKATIIAPQAVYDLLEGDMQSKTKVISNNEETSFNNLTIGALPMYNLPNDETARHPKGRGNGYTIADGNNTIYISGDTEDIPEMRSLKNIDLAFICMNLPYTMSVEQAADAVIAFAPKIVYPFHYRGKEGLSDVDHFKSLITDSGKKIDVRLRNWYPN